MNKLKVSVMFLCSDLVQMASYAPLFVNDNDRTLVPLALPFLFSNILLVHKCLSLTSSECDDQLEPRCNCFQFLATVWHS